MKLTPEKQEGDRLGPESGTLYAGRQGGQLYEGCGGGLHVVAGREHIRNLEERYSVRLFTRKPRLALTEEGEILRQALLQISNKEQDVKLRFEQLSKGVAGNINLGINSSRSSWLIPCFYTAYRRKFPHVSLSIYSDDTVRLTEQLRHGDLDIMFGVNAAFDQSLDYLHLTPTSTTGRKAACPLR